jgi:hypothetical protein
LWIFHGLGGFGLNGVHYTHMAAHMQNTSHQENPLNLLNVT